MVKTCMHSYEINKHKSKIVEGDRGEEIGFCLNGL